MGNVVGSNIFNLLFILGISGAIHPIKTIRDKHIDRLRKGECSPELGVYLSDLLINCERVSDHCSNIAVSIIQIAKSSMRSHVYLNELKAQRSEQFIGAYNSYHEKYRLSA